MLLVQTHLGLSAISGIGLFANQFIPKGTLIWKFTPGVDLRYTDQELEQLRTAYDLHQLERYMYRSRMTRLHVLCGDDARFINHSASPSTLDQDGEEEGITIAARDIVAGEEITSDYADFDADFASYRHLLK